MSSRPHASRPRRSTAGTFGSLLGEVYSRLDTRQIHPLDTRDEEGRDRFLPLAAAAHLRIPRPEELPRGPAQNDWIYRYSDPSQKYRRQTLVDTAAR